MLYLGMRHHHTCFLLPLKANNERGGSIFFVASRPVHLLLFRLRNFDIIRAVRLLEHAVRLIVNLPANPF